MARPLSIDLALPIAPLTSNQELFGELMAVYNAIRNSVAAHDIVTGAISPPEADWPQLNTSRVSVGGMMRIYIEAGENLTYSQVVGIANVAGVGKAKLAKDGVLYAVGWCSNPAGNLNGETTEIQLGGRFPAFPAGTLTPGAKYYLSAAAFGLVTAAVTTQVVGFAVSDTELIWVPKL